MLQLFHMFKLNFRPLDQRRKLMEENIKEIPGRIMLSEQKLFNVKSLNLFISIINFHRILVKYDILIKGAKKAAQFNDGSY